MNHIVLAGDSIFDNFTYVEQDQSVIDQLTNKLQGELKLTLLAQDGAVTDDLCSQFNELPSDTSHLFISSGGNDALGAAGLLLNEVSTVFEGMSIFSNVIDEFQSAYKNMLNEAVSRVDNVVVCTVYDKIPGYQKEPLTALKLFNEIILREAILLHLPVIDLRLVCNQPEDYSWVSPIEPSAQGGEKISNIILEIVGGQSFPTSRSVIWS